MYLGTACLTMCRKTERRCRIRTALPVHDIPFATVQWPSWVSCLFDSPAWGLEKPLVCVLPSAVPFVSGVVEDVDMALMGDVGR